MLGEDPELYPVLLESRFPHILKRISVLGLVPRLDEYLNGLLASPRSGCQGFPKDALIEIAALKAYFGRRLRERFGADAFPAIHCPRELFLALVDFDFAHYPLVLETSYPEILARIAGLLGESGLDQYIDALLTPACQLEHAFSEQALIELMTIKAANFARTAPAKNRNSGHFSEQDLEASFVFERIHRW